MEELVIKGNTTLRAINYIKKKIKRIIIEEGIKKIPSMCFQECECEVLVLPSSIEEIGFQSFTGNNIKVLDLSNTNIKTIKEGAFSHCNIETLILPPNLETIEGHAFYDNNITSLELPNTLTEIRFGSFDKNNISTVKIPDSVNKIENHAFNEECTIFYKGKQFNPSFIKKFGTGNIIKYLYILSLGVISEEALNNFPCEVLTYIKPTVEDIKGYVVNYKKYASITSKLNLNGLKEFEQRNYLEAIFKMCYILGLFQKPDSEVFIIIKEMINDLSPDELYKRWGFMLNYDKDIFIPKFKDIFMQIYKENKQLLYSMDIDITKIIYHNFNDIKNETYRKKNYELMKKQKELKQLSKTDERYLQLEKEISLLKSELKSISYNDVIHFIENSSYDIREGNEALKEIIAILALFYKQDKFNELQDIYERSKTIIKKIPFTVDRKTSGFTYKWSRSDDPINMVIGILMGCCSRLGGCGEDIMRQSMINPYITNLIIYDENNKIVGKATSFFNPEKKYILFNNIETKEIGSKGLKSAKTRKKELLDAIIRACNDVINELKKRGIDLKRISVGLNANDLEEELIKKFKTSKTNLLEQYPWKKYTGDADKRKGQAIIYQDDFIKIR